MLPFLYESQEGPITFAEAHEASSFGQYLATAAQLATPQTATAHIGLEIGKNPEAYRDLFRSAERQTMLVDTITSRNIATEEAYDRRIASIKAATGVDLPNPLRGGFQDQVTRAARDRRDAMMTSMGDEEQPAIVTGGQLFDQRLAELRDKHPDKLDALAFGDIGEEAKAIAAGAEKDYAAARKNPKLDPIASMATEFVGGMWGQRRDPLFIGSLFAGPTSAVGKTAVARVASSAVFQGLYNAGISALEQPAVQAWREVIGARSGVMPAIENVGMAFLFGLIPGAAIKAMHEAGQAAVRRTLAGVPERGDTDIALKAVSADEPQVAAVRMGEDMADADKAFLPRKPADVSPELHDDLTAAALKRADDPINQPSPEAVAAVDEIRRPTLSLERSEMSATPGYETLRIVDPNGARVGLAVVNIEDPAHLTIAHIASDVGGDNPFGVSGIRSIQQELQRLYPEAETVGGRRVSGARSEPTYVDVELRNRVAEAQPQNLREAQMAATEAIEERGNRQAIVQTREALAAERLPAPEPLPEGVKAPKAKGVFDEFPTTNNKGDVTTVSGRTLRQAGDAEEKWAAAIRECK